MKEPEKSHRGRVSLVARGSRKTGVAEITHLIFLKKFHVIISLIIILLPILLY